MTTPHRTLQMALDALDAITDDVDGTGLNTMPSFDKALDAIAALREALNAPEPEPYGHVTTHTVTGQQFFYRYPSPPYLDTAKECIAVYAAPPAAPDHLRDIAEKVAPAAPVVPLTDERITKALRRAFSLGQTYWQQADSDSYTQNAKSDETRQKFETLIVETLNGITGGAQSAAPAVREPQPEVLQQVMTELDRATRKFPTWPTDPLHALAVLGEEFGELTKAMLQFTYEPHKKVSRADIREEAIQTAAMALRLAMSLPVYDYAPGPQHKQDGIGGGGNG